MQKGAEATRVVCAAMVNVVISMATLLLVPSHEAGVQKEHGNSRLTTADIEGRIDITWKEKRDLSCTAAGIPTQRSAQGIFMQNGSVNRMSNSC